MDEMKLRLRELADKSGDLLDRYLEVDEDIVKQSGTFRSLFGRVHFDKLLERARGLQPDFKSFVAEVSRFQSENRTALSKEQLEFLDLLESYSRALLDTVNALVDRQHAAFEASKGAAKSKLTWLDFKRFQADYEASIRRYAELGSVLQAKGQRVLV